MPSTIESHPQFDDIVAARASGASLRDIASTVTPPVTIMTLQRFFKADNGKSKPQVRPLTASSSIDKPWAEARLVRIIERAMLTPRVEHLNIARAALRDLYEANGWMAPKRTESLVANLHALAPAQLRAVLAQVTSALPATMQHQLQQAEPDITLLPSPDPGT